MPLIPLFLPDSPPRGSADGQALPDSSTLCVDHSVLVEKTVTQSSAAKISSSLLSQSLAARPKSSSLSPSCQSMSPASSAVQTSSLGQRRKGLGRKVRNRNQRARGRPSCPPVARDGDRKSGKEVRMEEDAELEEEQMEAEAVANK